MRFSVVLDNCSFDMFLSFSVLSCSMLYSAMHDSVIIPDTTAAAVSELLFRWNPPLSRGATSHNEAISVNNNCIESQHNIRKKEISLLQYLIDI